MKILHTKPSHFIQKHKQFVLLIILGEFCSLEFFPYFNDKTDGVKYI